MVKKIIMDKYTLEPTQHLIRHCNPKEKQFFDSKMLQRGGKLIINYPKNLNVIETSKHFGEVVE